MFSLLGMGVLAMLVGFFTIQVNTTEPRLIETRAVAAVGTPFLEPAPLSLTVGQQVTVSVKVDVGTNLFDTGFLTYTYDRSKVNILNCSPGSGIKGVFTVEPCIVDAAAGTVDIQVEPVNLIGPNGIVTLVSFTASGVVAGPVELNLEEYEIIIEGGNGDPIEYIGGTPTVPTPTTSAGIPTATGAPSVSPTDMSTTVSAAPSVSPTSSRPQTYNPSSTYIIVFIIGAMLLLTMFH